MWRRGHALAPPAAPAQPGALAEAEALEHRAALRVEPLAERTGEHDHGAEVDTTPEKNDRRWCVSLPTAVAGAIIGTVAAGFFLLPVLG